MASEGEGRPRRPIEPLASVVSDSVSLGYDALELVLEGLSESLRTRSSRGGGSGRARGGSGDEGATHSASRSHGGSAAAANSAALIGDFAAVAAELLSRASTAAAEVAQTISERIGDSGELSIHELPIKALPGETKTLPFKVWNPGSAVLRNVTLQATELIGSDSRSLKHTVTFRPPIVKQIRQGQPAEVEVVVAVPKSAQPGIYRGVIQAEPGDTSAVLMLTVKPPPKPPPRSTTRRSSAS